MKFSRTTLQQLIIAVAAAAVAIVTVVYLYMQIREQGTALQTYVEALSESSRREESFVRIQRQVLDTAPERERLNRVFFADESDSADFLSEVEQLANAAGVSFSVLGLTAVPVANTPNVSEVKMELRYTGTQTVVEDFTRLLEASPYQARLDSLRIKQADGRTEGIVTLVVTINTL